MSKKYLIIIVLSSAVFVAFYLLYRWFQAPVSAYLSEGLSKQSENRLAEMKNSGEVSNNLTQINNAAGEVFSTNCFSIAVTLPFSSVKTSEQQSGKCLVRAALSKPRGTFVAHSSYLPDLTGVEDSSGVKMRLESSEYTQLNDFSSNSSTLAFRSDTELTIFHYQDPTLITISFSELGAVDETVLQAAKEALESLQVFTVE